MYKNKDSAEEIADRDSEINQVKSDMEALKTEKVLEAKEKMQKAKK